MQNFWQKLHKPIFCLAPMADVTDCAFRTIIAKYGKPDVFWTEFVSADGLAHPRAREKLLIDFKFGQEERPIVAQIFGGNGDNIREASKLIRELGFDGIDINMGCPDKKVEKQKAGAYCTKDPKLAREIIRSAKEGGESAGWRMPVSVKTRLGYNKVDFDFIKEILKEDLSALTIHLRTRKEMSDVPAHWELMPEILKIRDRVAPNTLIIGNGDVLDLDDGRRKCEEYGCDGVMLGRAIFGNPFLFTNKNVLSESEGQELFATKQEASLKKHENFLLKIFSVRRRHSSQGFSQELPVSTQEKLGVMVEHTKLFESMLGNPPAGGKNFAIMKKHYKAYVNGFNGAKELRMKLMGAENAKEVRNIVDKFLVRY